MKKEEGQSPERPTPEQTVYNQYWEHVRHVEDEMWTFTRIWAIIITAIFGIIGSELPIEAKIGTAGFGILLSVLGFFIVYSLRVPFFNFFFTLELIAKEDFHLDEPYRRFSDEPDSNLNKGVDIHDVLIFVYSLTAGILLAMISAIMQKPFVGIMLGIILFLLFMLVYICYIMPKFNNSTEKLRNSIWNQSD